MEELVHHMPWRELGARQIEPLLDREWLVTNGLGGYASGTIGGAATRRYHGLLIAAHPAPFGRMMTLNHLAEHLRLPDWSTATFGGNELVGGAIELPAYEHLVEFRLEAGLPVWHFEVRGCVIEKRIWLPHRQNTVYVNYRLLDGKGPVRLKVRPSVHFRGHDEPVDTKPPGPYVLNAIGRRYELTTGNEPPTLRMHLEGQRGALTLDSEEAPALKYRVEESRGYEHTGARWSPGFFRVDLDRDNDATLIASTESWETLLALKPAESWRAEQERRRRLMQSADPAARVGFGAELVLAADQFIITPAGRVEDAARALASGDEVRTVIAGYHWFTDWGRDTMISLEGLTLTTGRHAEGGYLLRTFAHYVRDGLIPNLFPEGQREGLYHTADATLWFFHAIKRYLDVTGDRETLRLILPKLLSIVEHHSKGTRFGIGVDPRDGLLRQGAEDYQLTWMDAKVGDWVVTPRRGKAVEINALWYNALCLLDGWVREEVSEEAAQPLAELAHQVYRSFNERFWCADVGYLSDVVDGDGGRDDPSLRPNQVLAISLDHPVLATERWKSVMDMVAKQLLTPVGLRSLAPGHPDYKSTYYGDLRARDAAYHQGTVWGWLIGPYIDAWMKLYPNDVTSVRRLLDGFRHHLGEACIGSISEIFDADSPYTPRGCVAQAWSVAEVLRCWVKTATRQSQKMCDPSSRRQEPAG